MVISSSQKSAGNIALVIIAFPVTLAPPRANNWAVERLL